MDDNQEYDKLLRSVFDSCDRNDSGCLSPTEFEDLCAQLSLEDEYKLLHDILFVSNSFLTYESFREALLLLLAGALTEKGCEDELKPTTNDRNSSNHFRSNSLTSSNDKRRHYGNEDLNDNDLAKEIKRDRVQSKSSTDLGERTNDSDWLVIDFRDNNVSPFSINEAKDKKYDRRKQSPSLSTSRNRKYGRRSQPDVDLLKRSSNNMDNHPSIDDKSLPMGLTDNVTMQSEFSLSSRVICEEFVGEGDGSIWINPETSPSPDDEEVEDAAMVAETTDPASDAQEALSSVWRQIIGDLDQQIDVDQLQELFHALSLTSSGGDVKQLFDILDDDGDGFICFGDFARQMSVFLTGTSDVTKKTDDDKRTACHVFEFDGDVVNDHENGANQGLSTTPFTNRTSAVHTPTGNDFKNAPVQSTPHLDDLTSQTSILSSSQRHQPAVSTSPTTLDRNNTSGFLSTPPSGKTKIFSSATSPDPLTSSSNRSRISNEDNEENDAMKHYHGVPSYRRRRRTNHASTRQHRRRANKTMSLPHYHPISRRRLEECLLYFLTDENGRYVEIDNLRAIWSEEGIDDPDLVLKELGVNLDDSFSIEALSEAMDVEVKENVIHHAACALYKSGIRYYRSQKEHESSEKNKLEAKVEHLDSQLQEQEERLEKMETDHRERLEELEVHYKEEISILSAELVAAQSNNSCRNEADLDCLRQRIECLQEIEDDLQKELTALTGENKQLLSHHNSLKKQLEISETNLERMKSDFQVACRQMMLCSQSHTDQQSRMDVLLHEYRSGAQKLLDENDELMGQLEALKKKWWNQNQIKSKIKLPTSTPLEPEVSVNSGSPSASHPNARFSPENPLTTSNKTSSLFFMPAPSGSRALISSEPTSSESLNHSSWRYAHDPDASFSHWSSVHASVNTDNNLLNEIKISSSGSVT
ncbi:unnamed protein product [Clavelina lepadiformis]|uniref:EF-hand domain-containing protein n=1 Tax=Clavelina lepadiformis TaxID=159417 RepID=A0ABP0G5V3_CLALP